MRPLSRRRFGFLLLTSAAVGATFGCATPSFECETNTPTTESTTSCSATGVVTRTTTCSSKNGIEHTTTEQPCEAGQRCVERASGARCVVPCSTDGDCDERRYCAEGACEARLEAGHSCVETRQCVVPLVCPRADGGSDGGSGADGGPPDTYPTCTSPA